MDNFSADNSESFQDGVNHVTSEPTIVSGKKRRKKQGRTYGQLVQSESESESEVSDTEEGSDQLEADNLVEPQQSSISWKERLFALSSRISLLFLNTSSFIKSFFKTHIHDFVAFTSKGCFKIFLNVASLLGDYFTAICFIFLMLDTLSSIFKPYGGRMVKFANDTDYHIYRASPLNVNRMWWQNPLPLGAITHPSMNIIYKSDDNGIFASLDGLDGIVSFEMKVDVELTKFNNNINKEKHQSDDADAEENEDREFDGENEKLLLSTSTKWSIEILPRDWFVINTDQSHASVLLLSQTGASSGISPNGIFGIACSPPPSVDGDISSYEGTDDDRNNPFFDADNDPVRSHAGGTVRFFGRVIRGTKRKLTRVGVQVKEVAGVADISFLFYDWRRGRGGEGCKLVLGGGGNILEVGIKGI